MKRLLIALSLLLAWPALAQTKLPKVLLGPPTTTTAGTIYYWNGSAWAEFTGNVSGTQCFQEYSSGVPAWGTCGSGSSGITIGTTTITSGTSGDIEYNNGGVFGEKGITGTGTVVLATAPSVSSLTVTAAFTATGLVTNADLANPSTTINGTTCTLGSTCAPTAANPNALTISSPLTGTSYNGSAAVTIACGTCGVTGSPLSQFAATTSAQLAGVISDETGTGALVFGTSPTFVTPALGTPASGVATNLTGLPLTTGVTGILPIANGGTATASPGLVAGTNVTITGSWPNQTINSSGGTGGIACSQTFTSTTAGGSDFTPTPGTSQALTATSCTLTTVAALAVYFDTGFQVPASWSLSGQVVTFAGGIPATVRQVTFQVGGAGGGNVSTTGSPAVNQIALFSGSTSTIAGVSIASTTTGLSQLTSTGTSSAPTFQTPAILPSTAIQNPTGTSSTTAVMMGLGSVWKLTPSKSGNVEVNASGTLQSTEVGFGCNATIRYGTGTAPSNNGAAAGTAVGGSSFLNLSGNTSLMQVPLNMMADIGGLTVGTPYWFDIILNTASTSTTCTLQNISLLALEK